MLKRVNLLSIPCSVISFNWKTQDEHMYAHTGLWKGWRSLTKTSVLHNYAAWLQPPHSYNLLFISLVLPICFWCCLSLQSFVVRDTLPFTGHNINQLQYAFIFDPACNTGIMQQVAWLVTVNPYECFNFMLTMNLLIDLIKRQGTPSVRLQFFT